VGEIWDGLEKEERRGREMRNEPHAIVYNTISCKHNAHCTAQPRWLPDVMRLSLQIELRLWQFVLAIFPTSFKIVYMAVVSYGGFRT